jgi:hypothetical protein
MGIVGQCRELAEIGELPVEVTYEDNKIRQVGLSD